MACRINQTHPFRFLRVVLFAAALLLLGPAAAYSEIIPSPTPPPSEPVSIAPSKPDSPLTDFGSPEIEMRERNILRAEKKQYEENLARAREAATLANELVESYQAKKTFSSDDGKKLERLAKITKRIRNDAG